MAVGFYVAKYVNKKSDMDLAAKGLGAKEWNNSLKTKLSLLPKRSEERFSRNAETDLVCRLLLEKKKFYTIYIDCLQLIYHNYQHELHGFCHFRRCQAC